jgi:hypothetical protein
MPAKDQHRCSTESNTPRKRKQACIHCHGVTHHELWCATQNATVHYALIVLSDPNQLSLEDELILHGLGVTWKADKTQARLRRLK